MSEGSAADATGAAPLAVATRTATDGRELVESRHVGSVAVVDDAGAPLLGLGDPQRPTFIRSAGKPLQATAALELAGLAAATDRPDAVPAAVGAADAGGDGPVVGLDELAVAWASHRGEPAHLAAVEALLGRAGIEPAALTCPPARSEADPGPPPERLRHECSGKHALFALAGTRLGLAGPQLLDPQAPLQRAALALVDDIAGPVSAVAVDGCGAPVAEVPLAGIARAYARIAVDARFAPVRAAGLAHPGLVGGTGRLESALLARGVVAKIGAEGLFAAGWRDAGGRARGLAVRAEDGAARAAQAAAIATLEALTAVEDGAWTPPAVLGGGAPVGRILADEGLREQARALT